MIGRMLLVCIALIGRQTCIGRLDPLYCIQRLPRLCRCVPDHIKNFKFTIALAQPTDSCRATRRRPPQPKKQGEQLIGATPIRPPAQLIIDEPAENLTVIGSNGTCFVRPIPYVTIETGVENIGEFLSVFFVDVPIHDPCEGHAEIEVGRHCKSERPRICNAFI